MINWVEKVQGMIYPFDKDGVWIHSIPEGWQEYVYKEVYQPIMMMLKERRAGFIITDMKEKWGSLRIYWTFNTFAYNITDEEYDEINKLIDNAEKATETICGICGSPATHISQGWIFPFCEKCAMKKFIKEHEDEFSQKYHKILPKNSSLD